MFKVEQDTGSWSNIAFIATYSHGGDASPLSPPVVYEALRSVVEQHPSLGIRSESIPVGRKGEHRAWLARIPTFDLADTVTFIDGYDDQHGFEGILESHHNEWLNFRVRALPMWRVVVVNRRHLLLVMSHIIGDGIAGFNFHQSFLAALNSAATEKPDSRSSAPTSTIVNTSRAALPRQANQESLKIKFSLLRVLIFNILMNIVIRFWYGTKKMLFSDIVHPTPIPQIPANRFPPPSQRCVTKLATIKFSASTMNKCVMACRANRTTFTSLLYTVITSTLAAEFYPKAEIGHCNIAVNLRPFLQPPLEEGTLTNSVMGVNIRTRLHGYRRAGQGDLSSNEAADIAVDIPLTWELAALSRAKMIDALLGDKMPFHDLMSMDLMPDNEEPYWKTLTPSMARARNNQFDLSNLGAFQARSTGKWAIDMVHFSSAASRASSTSAMIFAVASLKAGPCVIYISYEDGTFPEGRVDKIAERVERRLKAVVDGTGV